MSIGVLNRVVLLALCAVGANSQTTPRIDFATHSPYGDSRPTVSGWVVGVDLEQYKLAPLVFVPGVGTYLEANCFTVKLGTSGDFNNVTLFGGPLDPYATYIALLLVPIAADVPCYLADLASRPN